MKTELRCILPVSRDEYYFSLILTKHQKIIVKTYEKQDYILLEKIFDELIIELCVSDIDPSSLYVRDRQYILLMLRLESIKPDYPIEKVCTNPVCEREIETNVGFSEYPFEDMMEKIEKQKVLIANGQIELELDMMTRAGEERITEYVRKITNTSDYDYEVNTDALSNSEFVYAICASHITSVSMGGRVETPTFDEKVKMLESLSPQEFSEIREVSLGYTLNDEIAFDYRCIFCNSKYEEKMTWQTFFYSFMLSNINYEGIFMEIGSLCFSDQINFIKNDIDEMPPFERQGYIDYFSGLIKEQEAKNKNTGDDGKLKVNEMPSNINNVHIPQ
jgi:hypothetical protein